MGDNQDWLVPAHLERVLHLLLHAPAGRDWDRGNGPLVDLTFNVAVFQTFNLLTPMAEGLNPVY